jgi:hypothetical protein
MICPVCQIEMSSYYIEMSQLVQDKCGECDLRYERAGALYWRYIEPGLVIDWHTKQEQTILYITRNNKVEKVALPLLPLDISTEKIRRYLSLV